MARLATKFCGAWLTAAGLALATTSANAADLRPNDYSPTLARYSAITWTGPYADATLGYPWSSVDNNPTHPSGGAGGLEAGFSRRNGNFVYGGEADVNFSAANETFAPWQFSNPWFGTGRERASTIDNVLLFGTAGLAYGELTGTTSDNLSESHTTLGWVASLGADLGFAQYSPAKAEWFYLDLADRHFSITTANNALAANLVRLGLNDHF